MNLLQLVTEIVVFYGFRTWAGSNFFVTELNQEVSQL